MSIYAFDKSVLIITYLSSIYFILLFIVVKSIALRSIYIYYNLVFVVIAKLV